LEGIYPVFLNNKQVGTIRIVKQGLYYSFEAVCTTEIMRIYRLIMVVGDIKTDLGVCVPQSGGFGFRKRLPVKNVVDGEPAFYILHKSEQWNNTVGRICPGKPIVQLASLRNKALQITEGTYYLIDQSEDQRDNDQSP